MGCVSWGSLPPAEITWYRRMDNSQVIIIIIIHKNIVIIIKIIINITIITIIIINIIIPIIKLSHFLQSGFTPMVNANEEERSRSKVGMFYKDLGGPYFQKRLQ